MSIRVRGVIVITRKSSKYGDFNVGDLSTEIGVFEVKDQVIEEFEPGKYTGDFLIQWIAPDSFAWRGKVFVKNRATLAEILVDQDDGEAPPPAMPPEPDPIESPAQQQSLNLSLERSPAAAPPIAERPTAALTAAGDAKLFGAELWALVTGRLTMKLDPVAVDRQTFRQQRDRLKALAYRFDAKSQTWYSGDKTQLEAERSDQDIPF